MYKSENFRLMAAYTQKPLEARRSFRRFKRRRARRVVYARCTAHFSLRFGHYDCAPNVFWKTRMQRFFAYYCRGFSFAHYFQKKIVRRLNLQILKPYNQCTQAHAYSSEFSKENSILKISACAAAYSAANHSACANIVAAAALYAASCPDGTFMLPAVKLVQP